MRNRTFSFKENRLIVWLSILVFISPVFSACSDDDDNGGDGTTAAQCGNGVVEEGEECDGTNLGSKTCESEGYASGTLGCTADCKFDFPSVRRTRNPSAATALWMKARSATACSLVLTRVRSTVIRVGRWSASRIAPSLSLDAMVSLQPVEMGRWIPVRSATMAMTLSGTVATAAAYPNYALIHPPNTIRRVPV